MKPQPEPSAQEVLAGLVERVTTPRTASALRSNGDVSRKFGFVL